MSNIKFSYKKFNELSLGELYNILKLRSDVFIIEQECIYNDFDDLDQNSIHIFMKDENNKIIAYSRIIPPGVEDENAVILGRIVLAKNHRGTGLAREMIHKTIDYIIKTYNNTLIKIHAQYTLEKYYQSYGFKTVSTKPYDWSGMLHVDMELHHD